MFRDPQMSPWLAKYRLVHIGFPHIGDYDPICLDVSGTASVEAAVVRLDHEDILLERKKVHRSALAPGLVDCCKGCVALR